MWNLILKTDTVYILVFTSLKAPSLISIILLEYLPIRNCLVLIAFTNYFKNNFDRLVCIWANYSIIDNYHQIIVLFS